MVLLTGGFFDDTSARPDDGAPVAAATPTTAATSTAAEPTEDTSLQDALDEAGVSNGLVARLGVVAGDTGYGLTRGQALTGDQARGFAVLQISTCRELASGFRSLAEVIASDVAGGAPRADAETMAAFLRDTFCPGVDARPRTDTEPTTSATPQAPHTPTDGTRGLMSSRAALDASFPAGSLADCAAATGEPLGEPHAYALPGGELLCGDFITDGPWDEHFINLEVVFPRPVTIEAALPVLTALLPADIGPATTRDGGNPPYVPVAGSCLSIAWPSVTIGASVQRLSPDWGPVSGAEAILYSDRRTSDGSSAPFDGTVRVASLSFGMPDEPVVTC